MLVNAQSLCNKITELSVRLKCERVEVCCVTETWSATPSTASIPGYDLYTKNRKDKDGNVITHGGGVGVYINADIEHEVLTFAEHTDTYELLWVKIKPKVLPRAFSSITFGVLYFPPRAAYRKTLINHLQKSIDDIRCMYPNSGIVLLGDFNDLDRRWISQSLDLKQVVKILTTEKSTIDLIFTDVGEFYHDPESSPSLGRSAHFSVLWKPKGTKPTATKETFVCRPLTTPGKEEFSKWCVNKNWSQLYRLSDVNQMVELLNSEITSAYHSCFPEKRVKRSSTDKPWVTQEIKKLIRKRNKLHASGNRERWKKMRNTVVYECRKAEKAYGEKLSKTVNSDSRSFHKTVRDLISPQRPTTFHIQNDKGEQVTANDLNEWFAKICRSNPPAETSAFSAKISEIPVVLPIEVCRVLEKIPARKATHPADPPPILFKENAPYLSEPIAAIINQSLITGTFPEPLKEAVVIPVPKVTNPKELGDLRPISLTPLLSKVFETFINRWLLEELSEVIDSRQYGFQRGCSTSHYLIQIVETILSHLEVDEAFVDLLQGDVRKAFDTSSHEEILQSMTNFHEFLRKIVESFLSKRKQKTRYKGELSDSTDLTCGIPQGTKIGPTLFLLLCNTIAKWHRDRAKFADDLTMMLLQRLCEILNLEEMVVKLERDYLERKLSINRTKSAIMRISFLKHSVPALPDVGIPAVHKMKILGVIFNDKLTWEDHLNHLLSQAMPLLRSLTKLRRFQLSKNALVTYYRSHMRPILEYACPVWHPGLTKEQSNKLETIQKRALRIILGDSQLPYEECLAKLELTTLEQRRHELLMSFGQSILTSPKHRDLLPPDIRQDNRPKTRHTNQLQPSNPSATKRYKNSFRQYFTENYNK